jgi:hypothetical protein
METNISLLKNYAEENSLELSLFADDSGALITNYSNRILFVNFDNSISELEIEEIEILGAQGDIYISKVTDKNYSLYIFNDKGCMGTYVSFDDAKEAYSYSYPVTSSQ